MSIVHVHQHLAIAEEEAGGSKDDKGRRGQWWRFALILVVTVVLIVPIIVVFVLSVQPSANTGTILGFSFGNFVYVFQQTSTLIWLRNSLAVTLSTVLVAVAVAAPAGYVLSRGRSRAVNGYSLMLFIIQSLPVITAVIPLFILFAANLALVDTLTGITIIYIGTSMSVAIWMMAAYIDSIPITLEEAAWIDGASLFGGFIRVVLRNSLPGLLSTAIFTFLLSWNDYLVAIVFLRSTDRFTLAVGLDTVGGGPVMAVAVVMMIPPVVLFATLNRFFSVGGIGGSLAGQ